MLACAIFICALCLRADDTAAPAATPSPSYHASVLALLGDGKDIIAMNKAQIAPARELIKKKKYLFIYWGANWCPPCHVFVPRLIAFYNNHYATKGDFEVIFVSLDKSQSEMNTYMKQTKMPWIGLKLGSKAIPVFKERFPGDFVPRLALVDENDNMIAHSFASDGRFLGPDTALNAYLKLHGEAPLPPFKGISIVKGKGKGKKNK